MSPQGMRIQSDKSPNRSDDEVKDNFILLEPDFNFYVDFSAKKQMNSTEVKPIFS